MFRLHEDRLIDVGLKIAIFCMIFQGIPTHVGRFLLDVLVGV